MGNPFFSSDPDYIETIGAAPEMAGFLGVFIVVYLLIIFLSLAVSMASYVLHSLGLYTVADRRGIRNSWLAWIPVGNLWMLGSISDQFQYVAKGKIKNRRKVMLGLGIAMIAVYAVWFVIMIIGMISAAADPNGMTTASILPMVLGAVALFAVAIVLTVFQYLSYYDLFASCNKDHATLYLVLSIIVPITLPIFVFISRKKDLGMPPKKQPQTPVMIQQLPEEVSEEAETEETEEGYANPEEFEE